MGQRHMTYVVVENISEHCHYNRVRLLALYNQWNFEIIQPAKATRFLTALKTWQKNKALVDASDIAKLYQYVASVHPHGFSRFTSEKEHYGASYGIYDEDNNNGWQIVYVKYDNDQCTFKVHIGFKPGFEWAGDDKDREYMSVKDYLDGYLTNYPKADIYNFDGFLAEHTKEEQILLKKLNESFDAKEIERAEGLIKEEIEKVVAKKVKKVA